MVFSKDVLSLIPVLGCRCRCVRYILDENFEMIVREALRKLTFDVGDVPMERYGV